MDTRKGAKDRGEAQTRQLRPCYMKPALSGSVMCLCLIICCPVTFPEQVKHSFVVIHSRWVILILTYSLLPITYPIIYHCK